MIGRIALASLALLAGCDPTYHARVSDGAGMGEGSPVFVSGVQVGQVDALMIMEGEVDVEFTVDGAHEITLREDTCVLAVRGEDGSGLVLVPGEGAPLSEERAERPLPECHLPGQELEGIFGQLGDMLGSIIRAFGQGLSGAPGGGGPVPPTPQIPRPQVPTPPMPIPGPPPRTGPPPPPPPIGSGSACDAITVRVDRVEEVAAVPILLANGGHRVWLTFENRGDQTVQTGSVNDATFTDASRRRLTVAQLPSERRSWFMPLDVPANGSAQASVVFDGAERPTLAELEARNARPAGQPLSVCTIRATGLSAP